MAVNPDDEAAERMGLSDEDRFRLLDEIEERRLADRVRRELCDMDWDAVEHITARTRPLPYYHDGPPFASGLPYVNPISGKVYIQIPAWQFRFTVILIAVIGLVSGIVIGVTVL